MYKKNLAKIIKRKLQTWIERSHVTGRYVTKGKTLYSASQALDTPMKTDFLINTNTCSLPHKKLRADNADLSVIRVTDPVPKQAPEIYFNFNK